MRRILIFKPLRQKNLNEKNQSALQNISAFRHLKKTRFKIRFENGIHLFIMYKS